MSLNNILYLFKIQKSKHLQQSFNLLVWLIYEILSDIRFRSCTLIKPQSVAFTLSKFNSFFSSKQRNSHQKNIVIFKIITLIALINFLYQIYSGSHITPLVTSSNLNTTIMMPF
jgi:uncharacterized membrane protein